jgi:hypothetical protein
MVWVSLYTDRSLKAERGDRNEWNTRLDKGRKGMKISRYSVNSGL